MWLGVAPAPRANPEAALLQHGPLSPAHFTSASPHSPNATLHLQLTPAEATAPTTTSRPRTWAERCQPAVHGRAAVVAVHQLVRGAHITAHALEQSYTGRHCRHSISRQLSAGSSQQAPEACPTRCLQWREGGCGGPAQSYEQLLATALHPGQASKTTDSERLRDPPDRHSWQAAHSHNNISHLHLHAPARTWEGSVCSAPRTAS